MTELPSTYKEKMRELLGNEYDKYIESFNEPRLFGLRVNNAKISTEDFLKISPFKLTPIEWIDNGFYYDGSSCSPGKHPYYHAGLYYLQEPSAMTPANRLPIDEGDKVLDICAAPGGKATELGAKLHGTGLLAANDISNSRAKGLLKNLEVFGIDNVLVLSEDPEHLIKNFTGYFDKILLDAPCSGEGMFRKENKMIDAWQLNGPQHYAEIQAALIRQAVVMLTPGGLLMYSTCTFDKSENEDIIQGVIDECDSIEVIDINPDYRGFRTGELDKSVRLFPHVVKGEGHFMCLMRKKETKDLQTNRTEQVNYNTKIPAEAADFLRRVSIDFDKKRFMIKNDMLLYMPDMLPDINKIRFLRTGLYIGDCKKNRFEPSQALAMYLKANQYKYTIDLKASDNAIIRYLKGETIEFEKIDSNRYYLICVDGFPLGWGKGNNGKLKNKYQSGWRMMS